MKSASLFLTILFCQVIAIVSKRCGPNQRDRCNQFVAANGKSCSCSRQQGEFVGACLYNSDNPFLQCGFNTAPRNTCETFCAGGGSTCASTGLCSAN
jgi:hypothetical protein